MNNLLHLRIISIREETENTKTFAFENIGNKEIIYQAGQFLTFIFKTNTSQTRRSYSISSTWGIDKNIQITVKKVENGEISRFFINHIKIGDEFTCLPPSGRFTLNVNHDFVRDIFLIAGGSGISPMYSHLKNILKNEPKSNVVLLYSNKNESTTIFLEQLIELQKNHSNQLNIINLFSSPPDNSHQSPVRLNNSLLQNLVHDNLKYEKDNAQFLICGPSEMIRMAQITLHFMGFINDQIKKENFVIKPAVQGLNKTGKQREIKINLQSKTYSLIIPPDKYILQVALENNIELPYSCKGGRCSTCTTKLISGKVNMVINDVLTDKDIANGWILTCTAQPESDDVVIEIL